VAWRKVAVIGACSIALGAGLQGLYGPVQSDTFTPGELAASLWLYGHAAPKSVIVLPVDNIPMLDTPNYNEYGLHDIINAQDPHHRPINQANVLAVESWIDSLDGTYAYVVFSPGMAHYASYYDAPQGYAELANAVRNRYGWTVVYRNGDT